MEQSQRGFRTRAWLVLIFFAMAFSIAAYQLFRYTLLERDKYLREGRRIAWRKGEYHPLRASISDRDGIPLAWSLRRYKLSADASLPDAERSVLKEIFPDFDFPPGYGIEIDDIPAETLPLLNERLNDVASVKIVISDRRFVRPEPAVRRLVGEVKTENQITYGISGLEAEFQSRLAGRPGSYKVMLDRHGKWITGSWQSLELLEPGNELRLQVSLEEICREKP